MEVGTLNDDASARARVAGAYPGKPAGNCSESLYQRGHAFVRDGEYCSVWCFAKAEHAQMFAAKYGGEIIAVKDRPKWPG